VTLGHFSKNIFIWGWGSKVALSSIEHRYLHYGPKLYWYGPKLYWHIDVSNVYKLP